MQEGAASGRRDVSTSCDASWEDTWLSASAASGLTNLISSCWWHIEMACFAGCSPRLTRPTYTLISKTCPTLRSQLLCSSWCHLNLVPAGLSGVDKTIPPSPLVSHTKKTHTHTKKTGLLLWRWIAQLVTLVPFLLKPLWSTNAIKAINLQQKGFTATSRDFACFCIGA